MQSNIHATYKQSCISIIVIRLITVSRMVPNDTLALYGMIIDKAVKRF